ncbi:xylulokinase [Cumulibacter manganitolerans]|uniref:xylulokinase n=1 Tax=Cumulibacter manganitolerans TaxID=1884992 RepID=UPI0018860380|nr:FGGY family carbohydrate kinase [Cumulibacter manganitolerans]
MLSFDLGTSALKVGLVSVDGDLLFSDEYPLVNHLGADGASEQDPNEWWSLVSRGSGAVASAGFDMSAVVAVAVTGQFSSTVPVDANGKPTGPCIMWNDGRGSELTAALGATDELEHHWYAVTGSPVPRGSGRAVNHLAFLERGLPEIAVRTRWYLEPVDYLTMRLTGVVAATRSSMCVVQLFDIHDPERLDYDSQLVADLGIDPKKLPPLIPTCAVTGGVSERAARELGVPPGTPVVNGLPDNQAATLGSGAVNLWEAHFVISSTAWVSTPLSEPLSDAARAIGSVPSMWRGEYMLMTNQDTAGTSLSWLRDLLAPLAGGSLTIDDLVALAAESPPGAQGVLFAPWLCGERTPAVDSSLRASLTGIGVRTTLADLARAVLEGVAVNARWMLDEVEWVTRRRFEPIRFLGGGARSDLWAQIIADVFGRRIERVAAPTHAGLRGAALYALVAMGHIDRSSLGELVRVERVFTPDAALEQLYTASAARLVSLYEATALRTREGR